jgi:GrpB-like predicted nucleotidyltransferase (UPF0157 family)
VSHHITKMTSPIKIHPYNPVWKTSYEKEVSKLATIFDGQQIAIHHIGSTSIAGMSAKPIIDILIEVDDIAAIDSSNKAMIEIGYEPKGEYGIAGRRYFQKGGDMRTHHVHVFRHDSNQVEKYLLFRDYLRAHPEAAGRYAKLKHDLATQFPYDMDAYSAGKSDFINDVMQKAQGHL